MVFSSYAGQLQMDQAALHCSIGLPVLCRQGGCPADCLLQNLLCRARLINSSQTHCLFPSDASSCQKQVPKYRRRKLQLKADIIPAGMATFRSISGKQRYPPVGTHVPVVARQGNQHPHPEGMPVNGGNGGEREVKQPVQQFDRLS